jgi:hypothetical protein
MCLKWFTQLTQFHLLDHFRFEKRSEDAIATYQSLQDEALKKVCVFSILHLKFLLTF